MVFYMSIVTPRVYTWCFTCQSDVSVSFHCLQLPYDGRDSMRHVQVRAVVSHMSTSHFSLEVEDLLTYRRLKRCIYIYIYIYILAGPVDLLKENLAPGQACGAAFPLVTRQVCLLFWK